MSLLSVHGMGVRRDGRDVLTDVSFDLAASEVVGLIGPNGAGKTTLLRAALGLQPATGGSSLRDLAPAARARQAAFLPQSREVAWPVSVEMLVALGRSPHLGPGGMNADDRAAVDRALDRMEIAALRHRPATELSGGEQARALIARVLAQETPLILADEPTAGLDPGAQIATMEVFAGLASEGRGILVSMHDLGLAARHCTRILVVADGRLVADGAPLDVLTPGLLAGVFGITARFEVTNAGPVFQALSVLPG